MGSDALCFSFMIQHVCLFRWWGQAKRYHAWLLVGTALPQCPPNYSTPTPTHQEVHKSLLLATNWMPHAMHISFCGGLLFERWHRVYIQLVTRCFRGQFVDDHYTCDDCWQPDPHPIHSLTLTLTWPDHPTYIYTQTHIFKAVWSCMICS